MTHYCIGTEAVDSSFYTLFWFLCSAAIGGLWGIPFPFSALLRPRRRARRSRRLCLPCLLLRHLGSGFRFASARLLGILMVPGLSGNSWRRAVDGQGTGELSWFDRIDGMGWGGAAGSCAWNPWDLMAMGRVLLDPCGKHLPLRHRRRPDPAGEARGRRGQVCMEDGLGLGVRR